MTLSEASIQEACCTILIYDDWRRVRTDLKHLRGLGVQEPGIADDLFIRYWTGCINQLEMKPPCESWAQVLWCEWKKLDKHGKPTKPSALQEDWHREERRLGALTWVAGVDFEPTIEGFREHYKKSGLMRRKILS